MIRLELAVEGDDQGVVFRCHQCIGMKCLFEVRGAEACKAALRLLGVDLNSIQPNFFERRSSVYYTQYLP